MAVLRVALLQIDGVPFDVEANAAKAEASCRRAKEELNADIALMPEMFSVAYRFAVDHPGGLEAWKSLAQPSDGPFVSGFRPLARELEMAIAVTYLEAWEPLPRNTVTLVDRHGEPVLAYAKVHTCDFDAEADLTPGDGFRVTEIDAEAGPVMIGVMICYDREFPESARVLMLEGAEVILVPNSREMELNRTAQLRARATENMVAVALANYPGEGGRSMAFHPVMSAEVDGPPLDTLVVEAGSSEEIALAEFDLDAIRRYREIETWGNAYRKPGAYGALVNEEVRPPFVRPDARR
jgi:predicted amidohydrolase